MEFSMLSALQVLGHITVTFLRWPWFIARCMSRHYLIARTELSFVSRARCTESYLEGDWDIMDSSSYIRLFSFYLIFISSLIPSFRRSLSLSVRLSLSLYIRIYCVLFGLYPYLLTYLLHTAEPFLEANRFSASQEIPRIHKCSPPVPILC